MQLLYIYTWQDHISILIKKKTDDTDSSIWALFLKHDKVDKKREITFNTEECSANLHN